MAQFARPSSDGTTVGTWTDEGGATTNLFESFDEVIPSDADWASSPLTPVDADSYQTGLSSVTDPAVSTGHVARYRIGKTGSGGVFVTDGRNIDVDIRLRQGDNGSVIAEWNHTNLGLATTHAQTLSGAQADAITSYGTLFLEFDPTGATAGPGTRKFVVTWAELEVPDAAAGQNIPVGQAVEAEVGQPITPLLDRQVTVGQTTETETVNPIQAVISRDVAVGQAVEAETANPISPLVSREVVIGQATETETANSITPVGVREVVIGTASESETANVITPATARMVDVGQATESELARAITPVIGRMVAIGQAAEVETGQPIAPVRGVAVGRASEVELARLISPVKPIFVPLQTAVERELAQIITPTKQVPGQLGPAVCVVVSPSAECETFAL